MVHNVLDDTALLNLDNEDGNNIHIASNLRQVITNLQAVDPATMLGPVNNNND